MKRKRHLHYLHYLHGDSFLSDSLKKRHLLAVSVSTVGRAGSRAEAAVCRCEGLPAERQE
jgi:hypothetical protein